ncbi:uncharacterized protein LOC110827341 [Zootermopsis nevadensis]|uniref:Coiled-coil domain-containing protein 137 n=1 Tax=Zootermopsis nevadensis TaxID=136037 RepID=A0A067RMP0_ZOONE|nr:uncharacterized protein LOC110827341 [Zootermopsis nevadensis]KDR24303.1 Coiled-coil domain-containing protein 137 [Zootermopsis nevadensis]
MGRKIPGGKHKGVKDPQKQRDNRNASLQNRINAPPEIVDFQEVPKSVERLMKLNQALKDGRMQTKKRRMRKKKQKNELINTENLIGKEILLPGMTKADKPTQSFAQKPGETDSQFLHRIDEACHQVIQEAKFEAKYGVDINVDPVTGEVSVTKQPRDEVDEIEHSMHKKQNKNNPGRKSSKNLRKKQKLEEVKTVKLDKNQDDFERFQDNVKFGETVHAPPTIKAVPRKAGSKDAKDRPGRKDLLLKPMLQTKTGPISTFSRKLPFATHRQLELQRVQAVEAYRMLKARK